MDMRNMDWPSTYRDISKTWCFENILQHQRFYSDTEGYSFVKKQSVDEFFDLDNLNVIQNYYRKELSTSKTWDNFSSQVVRTRDCRELCERGFVLKINSIGRPFYEKCTECYDVQSNYWQTAKEFARSKIPSKIFLDVDFNLLSSRYNFTDLLILLRAEAPIFSGMYIFGSENSGKTSLSVALLSANIYLTKNKKSHNNLFTTLSRMLDNLKDFEGKAKKYEDKYRKVECLVIDDFIFPEKTSDWATHKIKNILEERSAENKVTIISSMVAGHIVRELHGDVLGKFFEKNYYPVYTDIQK